MRISRGLSVHLAVPVPPDGCCAKHSLDRSVEAAITMAAVARAAGFSVREPLTGTQVTSDVVEAILRGAACELVAGDVLLLTFAGHGCRDVVSTGTGHIQRLSESWCLADRRIYDSELFTLWPAFRSGVRIILWSDSCHSGTIGGPLPGLREDAWDKWREVRADLQRATAEAWGVTGECQRRILPVLEEPPAIQASVLVLAACNEVQTAEDGLFTAKNRAVLDGGGADHYCDLMDRVEHEILPIRDDQTPSISLLGRPFPEFLKQNPFTVKPPV